MNAVEPSIVERCENCCCLSVSIYERILPPSPFSTKVKSNFPPPPPPYTLFNSESCNNGKTVYSAAVCFGHVQIKMSSMSS